MSAHGWTVAALAAAAAGAASACNVEPTGGPSPNDVPSLTSITPSSALVGSPTMEITALGQGFVPSSAVRWNGEDRPSAFVDGGTLRAVLWDHDLTTPGPGQVAVFTPTPGGGVSNSVEFVVENPEPEITAVSPANATAGGPGFTLTVTGRAFEPQSVVRWDGLDRPTTYVDATTLRAEIAASDVSDARDVPVTVFSPPPGGGASNAIPFGVQNARPEITGLSPSTATARGSGFTLTVTGRSFLSTSVVRWDGQDRPTTFVDSRTLRAEIAAADIQTFRDVAVSVFSPPPGGGGSLSWMFRVGAPAIALKVKDMIYDAARERIYASAPGSVPEYGNTVVIIDPATATIESSMAVGSEPGKLAMSDGGEVLYVGLDGANAVRRVDLATRTAGLQFEVKAAGWTTAYRAEDIEVLPGVPGSVAISAMNFGSSPRHLGVIVFDDGVPRDTVTQGHTGSNRIEFSAVLDTLYGYNNETTEFGFRKLVVTAGGIREVQVKAGLISGFNVDIEFDDGRLYTTAGQVLDPAAGTLVGTVPAQGFIQPDRVNGRVFLVASGSTEIKAFSIDSYALIGSLTIPGVSGAMGNLLRWGVDGLAYRTENEIIIFQTDLVTR